jgi:hypothetical protein
MRRLRNLVSLATVLATAGAGLGVSGTAAGAAPVVPTLTAIRAAHHPGFDRLVFRFAGPLPERTTARWVDRVVGDASGRRVRVAGSAFLALRMIGATGHDEGGDSTYGPRRRAYRLPNVATVVNSGDFEATLSFGVGLVKRTSVLRTMRLTSPSRYVVDVRTNFPRTTADAVLLDRDRFDAGTPPYRRAVTRSVPVPGVARGALHRMYAGPTATEQANGLRLVRSGSTGFRNLRIDDARVARVRLTGGCSSGGSTFTVANLIRPTLTQFPSVRWVKIFSPSGHTQSPTGPSHSIPACLEP